MKDRYEQMTHNMTREYLRKCLYSFQKWKKVWECGWFKRSVFISNGSSHKPICFPDWMIGLYLTLENLDVIMPRISTVRNEGWDNSGLSCKISKWGDIAQKHTLQVIDESFDFQYVGTGLEYYNENKHMYILEGIEKSSSFDFFIRTNKAFVKLILKK